jgi:hypothetical protein
MEDLFESPIAARILRNGQILRAAGTRERYWGRRDRGPARAVG